MEPSFPEPLFAQFEDPEIHPDALHQHLAILAKFEEIMNQFNTGNADEDAKALKRFLIYAECRYVLFLHLLVSNKGKEQPLPPWDVAIIFHAHLVNPFSFRNDMLHSFPTLLERGISFPLARLYNLLASSGTENATYSSDIWNRCYPSTPYSAEASSESIVPYQCTYCKQIVYTTLSIYEQLCAEKSGSFSINCSNCNVKHCADTISARRLLNDCQNFISDPNSTLSGMHFTAIGDSTKSQDFMTWFAQAHSFKSFVLSTTLGKNQTTWEEIVQKQKQGLRELKSIKFAKSLKATFPIIVKNYRGFIHPLTMSLPEAALRQRSFSQKIDKTTIDSLPFLLQARYRYHRFFGLLKEKNQMLVPTLDIDLVWHTQQLHPPEYFKWCNRTAGRFINHDDNIGDQKLDSQLHHTSFAWFEAYQEPYMVDDANLIKNFWTAERVAKSILMPPYVVYYLNKLSKFRQSFWVLPDEKANTTDSLIGSTKARDKDFADKDRFAPSKLDLATSSRSSRDPYWTYYYFPSTCSTFSNCMPIDSGHWSSGGSSGCGSSLCSSGNSGCGSSGCGSSGCGGGGCGGGGCGS